MLSLRTSSGSNVTTPEAATPVDGYVLAWSSAANAYVPTASGGGSGTVTTVSIVTANGFSGSVANATTTPAVTLSQTTIDGGGA